MIQLVGTPDGDTTLLLCQTTKQCCLAVLILIQYRFMFICICIV